MVTVWDIWVRLFHWSLALAVTISLLSGETGFKFYDWHKSTGEIVLALVLFRLVWGLIGSSTARLIPLLVSPKTVLQHLKAVITRNFSNRQYGHNAAGGYAVLAILFLCGVQAATGLFIADHDGLMEGRFHGVFGHDLSHLIHDIHHANGGVLQLLLVIHVLMIAVYWIYAKTNLLKPMITGKANRLSVYSNDSISDDTETISKQVSEPVIKSWWFGLLVACVTAMIYVLLFRV